MNKQEKLTEQVSDNMSWEQLSSQQKQLLQSAAFERLLNHLQERTDVQNIDLMNLSGFCRNCLSRWLYEEATKRHIALGHDKSRTHVYGMDPNEWKTMFQKGDKKPVSSF